MRRRLFMAGLVWVAATIVLVVSTGETVAQSKSDKPAARSKQILFLHSFGRNFQQGAAWAREIQNELNRHSPWPLDIQTNPSSQLRPATMMLRRSLSTTSRRSTLDDRLI